MMKIEVEKIIRLIFLGGCVIIIGNRGWSMDRHTNLYNISLFKFEKAVDYYFIKIKDSGESEFTHYQREILEHKKGKLSKKEVKALCAALEEKRFFEMKEKYDVYPLEDKDLVYEDIYFLLKVSTKKSTKAVLAHEYAVPTELKKIIDDLLMIEKKLFDSKLFGYFLQVTEPDILSQVRWMKSSSDIVEFDEKKLKKYPFLKNAVVNIGDFIHITSAQKAKIEKYFLKGKIFKMRFKGKEFLVGIFERNEASDYKSKRRLKK